MKFRSVFVVTVSLVASVAVGCSPGDVTSGAAVAPSPASTPRATTATMSPTDTLNRLVSQLDEAGVPHQGPQWLQERAGEVCSDWESMSGDGGFKYAALGQLPHFRYDLLLAAPAVTHLTQYGCPQWFKYIN